MNLTPDILLAALEERLTDEEWKRLIASLRDLPEDAVFSLASQGNITVTGDGNVLGNNNRVFVIKGELGKEFAWILRKSFEQHQFPIPSISPKISIGRLPVTGSELFGREGEIKFLDESWTNPDTNIITVIASGGVGKSALVNHWLRRMASARYGGAERVFGWSFYTQGTSGQQAGSADLFMDAALRWFGDTDPRQGSPWDKGERLADLIRQSRTLLVLDGLEPLQYPPNWSGQPEGRLRDPALQACLRELAAHQRGLCVITTWERVSDLAVYEGGSVVPLTLGPLSPQAGAQVLRSQGVTGDDDQLERASSEFGGHSLALTLLGSYLKDVCNGDVRRRDEIDALEDDARHGGHARRVMTSYEKWLGDGPELAVLRMLGLFDRPAEPALIATLRNPPVILGLTDALQNVSDREWQQTLSKLRRINLLTTTPSSVSAVSPDVLDAHRLVREHFQQQLKRQHPEAWREANNRLYEHLARTAKEFPETIDDMVPLFSAVAHGCEAGRYQETFDQVYKRRIQRGIEYFDLYKLNAFGADLEALTCFLTRERQPISTLTEDSKTEILSIRGYNLRAMGRLKEAAQQMLVALEKRVDQEDWRNASINAGNLSRIYLVIGDLPNAMDIARRGVQFADESGDIHERMGRRAILADVLHQTGQWADAAATFREAEAIQLQRTPKRLILDSLAGFWYCELLLAQGNDEEVIDRATQTIKVAKRNSWPIDIAIDSLSLARAYILRLKQGRKDEFSKAASFLQDAVGGLRRAGAIDYLPLGLLSRAGLHQVSGDFPRAQADLEEARRISERGEMGLYLCDWRLEAARLDLAKGDRDKAHDNWTTAKEMIERLGYHRRDKDIDEIAEQMQSIP